MKPDLGVTRRFLLTLDPDEIFTFQTFSDKKDKSSSLNRVLHGSFDQYAADLERLNAFGAGVFVMVNKGDGVVRDGARTCRTNANVTAVRSLFVDLDGSPVESVLEASLPPDIVIESSPARWHAYWLLADCPLEDFEARQKQLAAKFEGDKSICDPSRVMRLPGFIHHKGEPFMSRLVRPE